MTLAVPWMLGATLLVVAVVVAGSWRHAGRRRRLAEFLGGRRAASRLSASDLYRSPVKRAVLLALAALALGTAAAGPSFDGGEEGAAIPTEDPPGSVVLVLDISASMQATDVEPTRLAQAVGVTEELLADLEGERVGLVLVAGTAYTLAPPTFDHDVLSYLVDGIVPDLIQIYDPGSLPAEGVHEALRLLDPATLARADSFSALAPDTVAGPRSVVLIGDGGGPLSTDPLREAGRRAREAGVGLHTVGVGTGEGGELSLPAGYRRKGDGMEVSGPRFSRFAPAPLRAAADETDGVYLRAGDVSEMARLRTALREDPATPPPAPEGPFWRSLDPVTVLVSLALAALLLEGVLDARLPSLVRALPGRAS